MTWLLLLRKFWYVVPMAVLGGLATFWHIRADYALKARDNAVEELRLARVAAFDEAARQHKLTREIEADAKRKVDVATAQSGKLARELRDFLTRPVPPPGAAPADSDAAARIAGFTSEVADALGSVVQACSRDSARFAGLQEWAERLTAK